MPVLSTLSSAELGEHLCGAFHYLSLPDLQTYLSTLWNNLLQTSVPQERAQAIHFPWVINHSMISDLVWPTVSPKGVLLNISAIQGVEPSYSIPTDQHILSKTCQLIPTMSNNYQDVLLRALRRGFTLRLLLDSRDLSSGSCHNMLWMINHYVGSMPP